MLRKFFNLPAFILAFEIAFAFCFFIGIFVNDARVRVYNDSSWYYINRGLPASWGGTSLADKEVGFPIIKAPFLRSIDPFIGQEEFDKVIDLRIFAPLFALAFLATYFPSFVAVKAAEENKSLRFILIPTYLILFLLCLFFYFLWFPRI